MGPGGFPGGPLIPQQQPQPQVLQLQQAPPPQQQQPPPQLQQQQGQQGQQQQQQAASQRVFTGTVTKLHDNFGFVDEDVFFQTSVVKGQTPRVNVCGPPIQPNHQIHRNHNAVLGKISTLFSCSILLLHSGYGLFKTLIFKNHYECVNLTVSFFGNWKRISWKLLACRVSKWDFIFQHQFSGEY